MTNVHMQSALRIEAVEADEWLSALLDGELDDDEAGRTIARLGKDAQAMQAWSEYSLIGDAMRGCVMDRPGLDQRIKAALAAEPTILAPVVKANHRPVYWAAAAVAVVAITWTVLSVGPANQAVPVAGNGVTTLPQAAVQELASNDLAPYLAAHQDYAFTVAGEPA